LSPPRSSLATSLIIAVGAAIDVNFPKFYAGVKKKVKVKDIDAVYDCQRHHINHGAAVVFNCCYLSKI